jgi:hypothetical protein
MTGIGGLGNLQQSGGAQSASLLEQLTMARELQQQQQLQGLAGGLNGGAGGGCGCGGGCCSGGAGAGCGCSGAATQAVGNARNILG